MLRTRQLGGACFIYWELFYLLVLCFGCCTQLYSADSWLCTQPGSLLAIFGGPCTVLGIQLGLAVCNANVNPHTVSLTLGCYFTGFQRMPASAVGLESLPCVGLSGLGRWFLILELLSETGL